MTFLSKKMRLNILKLTLITLMSNCSAIDTSKVAPGYKETYIAMRNAIVGFPQSDISPEVIRNIPYASMLMQIGKGPTGLIILERKL